MTEGPNFNFIVFYLILRKNWEWYKDHQKIPILTVLNLRFICAENYDTGLTYVPYVHNENESFKGNF